MSKGQRPSKISHMLICFWLVVILKMSFSSYLTLSPNMGSVFSVIVNQYETPILDFTFHPRRPSVGTVVQFNASYSTPQDQRFSIISYYWDFGDGEKVNTTDVIVRHCYIREGTYMVNLTVVDGSGGKNSIVKNIVVEDVVKTLNEVIEKHKAIEEGVRSVETLMFVFFISIPLFMLFIVFWTSRALSKLHDLVKMDNIEKRMDNIEKRLGEIDRLDETLYSEFVKNIDIFKDLSQLIKKPIGEIYDLYTKYRHSIYQGITEPITEFLFYIRDSYGINLLNLSGGSKPLGIVITEAPSDDVLVKSVMDVFHGEFFIFQSILKEKMVVSDIIKRASDLKIRHLVNLSYIPKAGVPEVQLGSRGFLTTQLIRRIISDLQSQGVYIKGADERYRGSYVVDEAERHGIKGFQLTFLGAFSENEIKELLKRILSDLSKIVLGQAFWG